MGPNEDGEKKDLTLTDVPDYDDCGEEEEEKQEEGSIREIIMVISTEFRTVGKKVDAFEKKLDSTQNKVERLTGQVTDETELHKTYRQEARTAIAQKNAAIEELKEAQNKIEKKQEESLQQIQQQVLKELDDKSQDRNQPNGLEHSDNDRSGVNSEWVRRAKTPRQAGTGHGRNDHIPRRYTDIARRKERARPQKQRVLTGC